MNTQHEHFDCARLNAIAITEVARRLGAKVKRAGRQHTTLCPWHDDHKPSLSLVEATNANYCHCFSCGRGGDVVSYVMAREHWSFQEACRWLSGEFGISTTQRQASSHHTSAMHPPQPQQPSQQPPPEYAYIPMPMLSKMASSESSLCRCLKLMFPPEAVDHLAEEYRLGTYALGKDEDYTVFPNIDHQGRVCNLKVQHYDTSPSSPRFAHSDKATCWLGAIWVREGRLPEGSLFRSDCLFGEHLLARYPAQPVALVESPKNALYGALAFPRWLWVATGNKHQLKRDVLAPLQGRDVAVIPDRDAIELWTKQVASMSDLANFAVSDFCNRAAGSSQPKFDIADYLQEQRLPRPF